jgi:hypothetical protein
VLLLSGLRLLNVPQANWIIAGGLIALAVVLAVLALAGRLTLRREPRPKRAGPARVGT